MVVIVEVSVAGPDRPPLGTEVTVQVRDVTLADASSELVAETKAKVRGQVGNWLDTVELEVPRRPAASTIWAHADVDADGRVGKGDFITMESFPLPAGEEVRVPITIRKV